MSISQEAYIDKKNEKFNLIGRSAIIPVQEHLVFEKATEYEQNEASHILFRELVGSLMYLATTSRPDIMFAVAKLARYFSCYVITHWKVAKEVLRYLSRTKDFALIYSGEENDVIGYLDADWAGNRENRKYTGGFVSNMLSQPLIGVANFKQLLQLKCRSRVYCSFSMY